MVAGPQNFNTGKRWEEEEACLSKREQEKGRAYD